MLRHAWRARRAACCALLLLAPLASAQNVTSDERALKVAFLYNFALYTEWPMPLPDGLNLCVLGHDDLGPVLDTLAGRQINGKSVILRRLDAGAGISGCHVIYIAAAGDAKSARIVRELRQKPILSVTDAAGADFSMISLSRQGMRLVFDIDNSSARAAGLVLSSKLLRLAHSVH